MESLLDSVPVSQGSVPDFIDLEERILQLCSESPKGITTEAISRDQPKLDTQRMLRALQRLLSQVLVLSE